MFHGNGILDKAIGQLNLNDKEKFSKFIRTQTSFNQGNMFVTKSKKIMDNYYKVLFEWLRKCEDIFGFNLDGYGKTRIYAFLAERFTSFWFNTFKKRSLLSYARLGGFHLSNTYNSFVNTMKLPFTFSQYPTIHKF